MGDNSDLFTSPTTPVETTPLEPTPAPSEHNYLEDLVGEGKKFKSPQDLARGKYESDQFIERLQGELSGIRDELKTRMTLEEFMTNMASETKPSESQQPNNQTPNSGEPAVEPSKSTISPEDIESLLDSKLSQRDAERQVSNNLETVRNQLVQHWGPNYKSSLEQKAAELGLGEAFLNDLAQKQPTAFIKLVGIEGTPSQTETLFDGTAPNSSVNTSSLVNPQNSSGRKDQNYYKKLKDSNPDAYWSVSIQNEMHNEAQKQGESFFN